MSSRSTQNNESLRVGSTSSQESSQSSIETSSETSSAGSVYEDKTSSVASRSSLHDSKRSEGIRLFSQQASSKSQSSKTVNEREESESSISESEQSVTTSDSGGAVTTDNDEIRSEASKRSINLTAALVDPIATSKSYDTSEETIVVRRASSVSSESSDETITSSTDEEQTQKTRTETISTEEQPMETEVAYELAGSPKVYRIDTEVTRYVEVPVCETILRIIHDKAPAVDAEIVPLTAIFIAPDGTKANLHTDGNFYTLERLYVTHERMLWKPDADLTYININGHYVAPDGLKAKKHPNGMFTTIEGYIIDESRVKCYRGYKGMYKRIDGYFLPPDHSVSQMRAVSPKTNGLCFVSPNGSRAWLDNKGELVDSERKPVSISEMLWPVHSSMLYRDIDGYFVSPTGIRCKYLNGKYISTQNICIPADEIMCPPTYRGMYRTDDGYFIPQDRMMWLKYLVSDSNETSSESYSWRNSGAVDSSSDVVLINPHGWKGKFNQSGLILTDDNIYCAPRVMKWLPNHFGYYMNPNGYCVSRNLTHAKPHFSGLFITPRGEFINPQHMRVDNGDRVMYRTLSGFFFLNKPFGIPGEEIISKDEFIMPDGTIAKLTNECFFSNNRTFSFQEASHPPNVEGRYFANADHSRSGTNGLIGLKDETGLYKTLAGFYFGEQALYVPPRYGCFKNLSGNFISPHSFYDLWGEFSISFVSPYDIKAAYNTESAMFVDDNGLSVDPELMKWQPVESRQFQNADGSFTMPSGEKVRLDAMGDYVTDAGVLHPFSAVRVSENSLGMFLTAHGDFLSSEMLRNVTSLYDSERRPSGDSRASSCSEFDELPLGTWCTSPNGVVAKMKRDGSFVNIRREVVERETMVWYPDPNRMYRSNNKRYVSFDGIVGRPRPDGIVLDHKGYAMPFDKFVCHDDYEGMFKTSNGYFSAQIQGKLMEYDFNKMPEHDEIISQIVWEIPIVKQPVVREYIYRALPEPVPEVPQPKRIVELPNTVEVYEDNKVPVVFRQVVKPAIAIDETQEVVTELKRYNPVHIPVDVYVQRPVEVELKETYCTVEHWEITDVDPAQYNSMLLYLNPHLQESKHGQMLPFKKDATKREGDENRIPFLPVGTKINAIPLDNAGDISLRKASLTNNSFQKYQGERTRFSSRSSSTVSSMTSRIASISRGSQHDATVSEGVNSYRLARENDASWFRCCGGRRRKMDLKSDNASFLNTSRYGESCRRHTYMSNSSFSTAR